MKRNYDRASVHRHFKIGDKVLALLPIPGSALSAKFLGPYELYDCLSDTDYAICTPERRRKTRVCHVNMLKRYHPRAPGDSQPVVLDSQKADVSALIYRKTIVTDSSEPFDDGLVMRSHHQPDAWLCNSDMITCLRSNSMT